MKKVCSEQELKRLTETLAGCLLGTAVGDAVGLAAESLSRRRQSRLYPNLDGPRLIGNRGMVSDDTEHACLVAVALAVSGGDPEVFERHLARGLRRWITAIPAGVGWATLRACGKLCLGVSPSRSGAWSAGNGPAMRSASIGVAYGHDTAQLITLVRISTRITHTDPKAEAGALAVAVAAFIASDSSGKGDCHGLFLRR